MWTSILVGHPVRALQDILPNCPFHHASNALPLSLESLSSLSFSGVDNENKLIHILDIQGTYLDFRVLLSL